MNNEDRYFECSDIKKPKSDFTLFATVTLFYINFYIIEPWNLLYYSR